MFLRGHIQSFFQMRFYNMNEMKVSIIIPNYNGAQLLKDNFLHVVKALRYWQQKEKLNGEIVVVDDASNDNSLAVLHALSESITKHSIPITIIDKKINDGFAASVNKGVSQAVGELIVLLNTDVKPDVDFLLPLLEHFENKDIFSVGCMEKSIENGETILRGRGIGTWRKGLLVHSAGSTEKKTTLWTSGGSSAFRKSIWDTVGAMNTMYRPFYWEDIDLSYRAVKSGFIIRFEPKSIITHYHSKGSIRKMHSATYIKTIAYRNQFLFAWANMTDFDLIIKHVYWLPYHLISAMVRRDLMLLQGFYLALLHVTDVLRTRNRNKKIFVKSDKAVIESI